MVVPQAFDAWILDLDGVLWTGPDAIEGSAEAVGRLRAAGFPTLFVTNNSFSRIAELEAKLAGFGVEADGMVISSAAAGASLVAEGSRAFVLGGPGVTEALTDRNVELLSAAEAEREGADAVVVGLDWNLSYERLSAAVLAIRAGADFVATNSDVSYPSERGLLPGGGSIVAAVATATGTSPKVAGKPNKAQAQIVHQAIGRLVPGRERPSCVMVGDRPDTDGEFARQLGATFGLVLSGVTTTSDLPTDPEADLVAERLSVLVDQVMAQSAN